MDFNVSLVSVETNRNLTGGLNISTKTDATQNFSKSEIPSTPVVERFTTKDILSFPHSTVKPNLSAVSIKDVLSFPHSTAKPNLSTINNIDGKIDSIKLLNDKEKFINTSSSNIFNNASSSNTSSFNISTLTPSSSSSVPFSRTTVSQFKNRTFWDTPIINLDNSSKVPYVHVTKPNEGSVSGSNTQYVYIIVGSVLAIVLIVAVIVLIIIVLKRHQAKKQDIPTVENPIYRKKNKSPDNTKNYRFSTDTDLTVACKEKSNNNNGNFPRTSPKNRNKVFQGSMLPTGRAKKQAPSPPIVSLNTFRKEANVSNEVELQPFNERSPTKQSNDAAVSEPLLEQAPGEISDRSQSLGSSSDDEFDDEIGDQSLLTKPTDEKKHATSEYDESKNPFS